MLALIGGYLIVFLARVADVSLGTIRIMMLVRRKRLLAGLIGFFEVSIFLIVLKFVFDRLSDPMSLICYALGFATGNIVGSYIEERLALGYLAAQIVPCGDTEGLIEALRKAGFGVTCWEGIGREGPHPVINVSLRRKDLPRLQELVDTWTGKECVQSTFMVVMEAHSRYGGVFNERKGK